MLSIVHAATHSPECSFDLCVSVELSHLGGLRDTCRLHGRTTWIFQLHILAELGQLPWVVCTTLWMLPGSGDGFVDLYCLAYQIKCLFPHSNWPAFYNFSWTQQVAAILQSLDIFWSDHMSQYTSVQASPVLQCMQAATMTTAFTECSIFCEASLMPDVFAHIVLKSAHSEEPEPSTISYCLQWDNVGSDCSSLICRNNIWGSCELNCIF